MTAKEFIEKEYQDNKKTWSLPPLDPKWKKFAIQVIEKYHQQKLNESKSCNPPNITYCQKQIDDNFDCTTCKWKM